MSMLNIYELGKGIIFVNYHNDTLCSIRIELSLLYTAHLFHQLVLFHTLFRITYINRELLINENIVRNLSSKLHIRTRHS